MSYQYNDPTNYRVTTSTVPDEKESSGGGWVWGILLLLALLIIGGLIVWLVLVHNRDTKGRVINFTGENVAVTSDTAITGTWTKTDNNSDVITLYATLNAPQFDSKGKITNSDVKTSNGATNGASSVSLSGLQARLKYYATLIITNSGTSNYQVYTQLVYMDSKNPQVNTTTNSTDNPDTVTNYFAIEDILQIGKLQIQETSGTDTATVRFEQRPTEANSLWNMNADGQIVSRENSNLCLYSNGGTLAASNCATLKTNNLNSSKWIYNPGEFANRWCLANTAGSSTPSCMVLGAISSGSATVSVNSSSTSSDSWANAFEIL